MAVHTERSDKKKGEEPYHHGGFVEIGTSLAVIYLFTILRYHQKERACLKEGKNYKEVLGNNIVQRYVLILHRPSVSYR